MIENSRVVLALERVRTDQHLHAFKRKVHKLRRLVAGDLSALDDSSSTTAAATNQTLYKAGISEFYDILVTDVEEGRNNKMMQGIRTLLFQTMTMFPDIEVENTHPDIADFMSQYVKVAMGSRPMGCAAVHQMRLGLLDYLVGGLGWVKTCLQDEAPTVLAIDTLDMVWDLTAVIPQDIQWAACRRTQPLYRWLRYFDSEKGFTDLTHANTNEDHPVAVWFYYTLEGDYVAVREGHDEEIEAKDNPYSMPTPSGPVSMLPFESCYHFAQQSVRFPTGIAEQMLPAQIACWEAARRIRRVHQSGAPFWEVQEGSYDEESMEQFEDGDPGAAMVHKQGSEAARANPGFQNDPMSFDWLNRNEEEIVAMGGANPYASGNAVKGVKYASEVQAIQGNAGLVAGVIAKDNASFWERVTRKFFAIAHQYDDRPFQMMTADGLLQFDSSNPVKDYIDPMAEIIITEDSMTFRPQVERIREATEFFMLTLQPQVATMFPEAPKKAFEDLLRAKKQKNMTEWMQAPSAAPVLQPQGAPQDGGMPVTG